MTQIFNSIKASFQNCETIVDVLRYRSFTQPDKQAFIFLEDGEISSATLTYKQLEQRSRAIASLLQSYSLRGERALLLYPPGLDYLTAFFGCLYAEVVAVPAYPPHNQRNTPRIQAIVADALPRVALTTSTLKSKLQCLLAKQGNIEGLQWLTTDNVAPGIEDSWLEPLINVDTLAFLQYTSGSTGTPKGVMLSHGNLVHNTAMTYQLMEHSLNSRFVSWLPVYHDMGLIGGILQPLYGGFPCILMAPASFLQQPYRWLQAVSYYKGTTSGGPNFAYELCIQKITQQQRSSLDLSSWSVAFNGAEPVRKDTLQRFVTAFAECGFRQETFYPCYGMAEATLMVSGGSKTALPQVRTIEKFGLSKNKIIEASAERQDIQSFVSCGQTIPEQQIVIAHPETLTRCQPCEVGEIWVCGPSIGQGYWNRPLETEQTFSAYLTDTGEGPFLRTGDLGFLHNGELYITGRVKDLIIIRGRNLYPQDIELTVECSHSSLRSASGAAFSVEVDNEERLVVVQELEFRAKPNVEEVVTAIRQAVAFEHEVQTYAVILLKPGTIPKTSSGKIQRCACKAKFLAGSLEVVDKRILSSTNAVSDRINSASTLSVTPLKHETALISHLQKLVAQVFKIVPSQVQPQQPLTALGMDSLIAFDLKNRIEADFGVAISVTNFLQDVSILHLTKQILAQVAEATPQKPKLEPIPRNKHLPLCLAQERLWFLEQLEPGNPFYNVPVAIQLTGKLNAPTLEQSLNEVIKGHETLQTSFEVVEGYPVQVIHPPLDIKLPIIDFTTIQNPVSQVEDFILEETQYPFNLSQAPLLRAKLLRLQENKHLLLLTMHHMITDGWSIGILLRELAVIYEAFLQGQSSPLSKLPIQYADFAYWQRQWLQGEVLKTQLDYWKQQLSGNISVLQLPTDRPRPPIQTFAGKKQVFILPKYLIEGLKDLSQQEGVTFFMALLTVFKTLLHCYTKQEDILVGSPVAGRNHVETQGLIGFFINTLVLRTYLGGNPTFRELLQRVQEVALGAYAHQELPFEKLVEELQPKRNLSHNPLFQVMFILQNAPISSVELSNLKWQIQEIDNRTSKFDLKLSFWESLEGLNGSLEYKTDLFNATTIKQMVNHFEMLLRHIVIQPEIRLNELANIFAEADEKQEQIQQKELENISREKLKLIKRNAIIKE
ncbi:condensation domain-containing protein [Scytonema sp. NUACC26]|uniref:condensation domain-containing protein n=1 Tax=Scytonema sp. NUACC26 TaxID=3140176 RepID=UPI0034DB7E5D